MRYWTSDLHLGHKNIIEYCLRPYADVEAMNKAILDYLIATLKSGDTLVVVGDAAMNPKHAGVLAKALKAHGVKLILVAGNHDSCFEHKGREMHAANQRGRYYNDGWSEIHQTWKTHLSNGQHVLVSHLPYATEEGLKFDVRYQEHRPKDEGAVLIHGHLHGKYKKFGRMVDVGIDPHEMKILSETELIALINDPRDFIPTHLGDHYANRVEKKNMKGMPNGEAQVQQAPEREPSL